MRLKAIYQQKEDIPEQFAELFTERNGQFELTGVEGMQTDANVERLELNLRKEREAHKETKAKLGKFNGLEADEVFTKLDRYDELEAAAGDKIDDDKINEMVEARLKTRLAPIERENAALKASNEELTGEVDGFKSKERTRTIRDTMQQALTDLKVRPEAHEDALFYAERVLEIREDDGAVVTRDNVGVTPGIAPKDLLADIQTGGARPHWWETSQGGGARPGQGGGYGKNPWSKEHFNMTEQGRIVKEEGIEKATQMANAAGVDLGGAPISG